MTKILFFNILFIYSFPLFAQNYQAEYSEFGTFNHGHATLLFNKDAWFYDMFYQEEMEISSDDIYISDEEAEDKLDIRRFNYYSLDKKYFLWEESDISEKCVIKGDLDPLNWIIFNDSTKTIGGYHCMLAQCDLCGWNIKAWFTPEIPVGCGPWRLWGLPGD